MDSFGSLLLVSSWLLAAAGGWVAIGMYHVCFVHLPPWHSRIVHQRASRGELWPKGCLGFVAGPAVLLVLYLFHWLWASPLSVQATVEAVLHWSFVVVFGLALYRLGQAGQGSRRWLAAGWLAMGSLLAITALASVLGVLSLPGAIVRTDDGAVSATGARLGGLLQYPNTFGVVMAVFALERLMRLARLSRRAFTREGGWQGQRAAVPALLFTFCLLLSESRGALAAALLGWAAGCALLRGARRWRYALHSAALLGAAASLAGQLAAAQLAPSPLPALLALAAVLAALALAQGLAARYGPRRGLCLKRRRYRLAALAIAALLLAAAGLRAAAEQGFSGRLLRPETGLARAAMYGDAVQLLRQAPWLGQGGDTWRHAFRSLQSTPYVGSEVHSGYLDLGLDIGLPGLVLVLLWLGLLGVRLTRRRSVMLPSYVALLLHSAIDFDMSYGLIWLLILWMAADAGAALRAEDLGQPKSVRYIGKGAPWLRIDATPSRGIRLHWLHLSTSMARISKRMLPVLCLLAAVGCMLLGLSGLRQAASLTLYQHALRAYAAGTQTADSGLSAPSGQNLKDPYREAPPAPGLENRMNLELLRRALELAPYRHQARFVLASWSDMPEKESLLREGLRYESADARLWLALGRALAGSNQIDAVPAMRQAADWDRFNHRSRTLALQELLQLAERLREQGRMRESLIVAKGGLALYEEYANLAEMLTRHGMPRNDRQFYLTSEAANWGMKLQGIFSSFAWSDHELQARY